MKKLDYMTQSITRQEFVKLCKKNEVNLIYLRKNNNCENYNVRLKIINYLDKHDIAQTSIAKIFTDSFESISKRNANLSDIASYLLIRRNISNNLRDKLKSINFEKEIKSTEHEIELRIEELQQQIEQTKNDLKILQNYNLFKINKIKNFINKINNTN